MGRGGNCSIRIQFPEISRCQIHIQWRRNWNSHGNTTGDCYIAGCSPCGWIEHGKWIEHGRSNYPWTRQQNHVCWLDTSPSWERPNNIALFFGQDPCVSGLLKRDIVYTLRGSKSQISGISKKCIEGNLKAKRPNVDNTHQFHRIYPMGQAQQYFPI